MVVAKTGKHGAGSFPLEGAFIYWKHLRDRVCVNMNDMKRQQMTERPEMAPFLVLAKKQETLVPVVNR